MFQLGVKSDIDKVATAFEQTMGRQVPYAISLALNRTSQLTLPVLQGAMARTFDRPKPYTLNSLYFKPSSKTNLSVTVGHKDGSPVNKYLRWEIEGGARRHTGIETLIGSRVGSGVFLVPAKTLKLDAYGNVPASVIRRIVAGAAGKGEIFIVPLGGKSHLAPGIYLRKAIKTRSRYSALAGGKVALGGGSKPEALMLFVRQPKYHAAYDLKGSVERTFQGEFGRQFSAAMDYALATSKVRIR